MSKYVLVYTGGKAPETEEEGAVVYAAWSKWLGGLGSAVVDGGNPFGGVKSIAPGGQVSDGPAGSHLAGYSIIDAGSFDQAVAHAKGCPHLQAGGTVSVYEVMDM